jgi:glycerol uptake facilitator-like aquaporin
MARFLTSHWTSFKTVLLQFRDSPAGLPNRGFVPRGELRWHAVPAYIAAQLAGAILGVWLSHIMFDLPIWQLSPHVRTGVPQWVAEVIATFGLLSAIWGCRAHREPVTAFAVGAYITGAYWFTASTSFANPAVTVARALTGTFAGIRPADAPGFILAQLAGLALALPLARRPSPEGAQE